MQTKDKIILILFILFLILAGGFLWWLNSEGSKCLVSPYIYTYNSIKPEPYYCSCQIQGGVFEFNGTYFQIKQFSNIRD
jgi:hypothetical protein